ncbi:MAG TPA: thioredoxin-like domain-containing protein [Chryseosolibacter sp.]
MRSLLVTLCSIISVTTCGQTAERILENYFTSIGGVEALRKFNSSSVRSLNIQHWPKRDTTQIVNSTRAPHSSYTASWKSERLVSELFNNPKSGVTVIFYEPFLNKVERPHGKHNVQLSLAHELLFAFDKRRLKKVADTTINENPVYAVQSRLSKKDSPINRTYYFDKSSNRLVACRAENIKGNFIILEKYERHGDLYFPMRNVQYLNGLLINEFVIQSLDVNPALNDSIFFPRQRLAAKPKFKLTKQVEYLHDSLANLSLDDFIKTFAGKTILIDLWASWCGPCKYEFSKYDDAYYHYLRSKNIQPVYISLDKVNKLKEWKEVIDYFTLSGFHIRAEKKIIQSIQKKIYDGGQMYIPRLILVGKNGEIISSDVPKLSSGFFYTKMEELVPAITP